MSRRRNTTQILKECLSVLAVILSCLVLAVGAQQAQSLFKAAPPPAVTSARATPTSRPTAKPTQAASLTTPVGTAQPASTAQPSLKSVKLSGKWVGAFAETVDGSPQQYLYTLELTQQGTSISGKSTIQKEDDPNTFARFLVRGQVARDADTLSVKIVEELLGAKNLHNGSAAAPRNTRLNFVVLNGTEYLEGEWSDRRFTAASVTGTLKLTRQP